MNTPIGDQASTNFETKSNYSQKETLLVDKNYSINLPHLSNTDVLPDLSNSGYAGVSEQQILSSKEIKHTSNIDIEKKERPFKLYCYGNAECEQFYINEDESESKRPVSIDLSCLEEGTRISKIACGVQHTILLSDEGKVYSFGNTDGFCLGRPVGKGATIPGLVDLPEPVDLISAGESHSAAANSVTGRIYIWGLIKSSLKGKIFLNEKPLLMSDYQFLKKGISKMLSGLNHILVLSGARCYSLGDNDTGALGTVFRGLLEEKKVSCFSALPLNRVKKIFATAYASFLITLSGKVYACGLNNYEQLGFKTIGKEDVDMANEFTERNPKELCEINGNDILEIVGGEQHNLILLKNGSVFGAGRNDDGQLGELSESQSLGGFKLLSHLPPIQEVQSYNHYNYANVLEGNQYIAWGSGFSYVLANGKEDSLAVGRPVNNEKFFKNELPSILKLGFAFVCYLTGEKGNTQKLRDKILLSKKIKNYKPRVQKRII